MNGLFEIHVTIDPKDVILFRLWALDNDVKAIYILGEIPELTFSKYKNGTYETVYDKAMSIARNLILNNITVLKIRIEAIFSNQDSSIDLDTESNNSSYFEFHIKYHIINSKDYYELTKISKNFTNENKNDGIYSFVGFNSLKKNIEPIISLRVPAKFKITGALKFKDKLLDALKINGFKTNEEIHKEYVILDEMYNSKL